MADREELKDRFFCASGGVSGISIGRNRVEPTVMAGLGRPGRPSKGPRKRVEVKMPLSLAAALENQADEAGQDVGTWVVELVAQTLGHPLPGQERLPLNDAA